MRKRPIPSGYGSVVVLLLGLVSACSPDQPVSSTLIQDAKLIDGTNAPGRQASVRIDGDRVVEIGDLEPISGETVVEAHGLVLAPGFVDTHSHHDIGLLDSLEALALVSQGVTTIAVGADGGGFSSPLRALFVSLEETPAAVNVAAFSGHNRVRLEVMGSDFKRPATTEEIESMASLVKAEMEAGALGLSTGLEYEPGIYSDPEEVVALAHVAAAFGGRYSSHVRSEGPELFDAIEELLHIGKVARLPVQVSHIKLGAKSLWGRADRLLKRLDEARADGVDATADIYPYEYWQTPSLLSLLPEHEVSRQAAQVVFEDIAAAEELWLGRWDPDPSLVGLSMAEVAAERGKDVVTTFLDLVEESQAWEATHQEPGASVLGISMQADDIAALVRWPHTNICTDGGLASAHPRGRGTYPRVLGRFVREEGLLTLEEAIHKAAGLAARHLGLLDRGYIREGGWADLVLLNPEQIIDRATAEEPLLISTGIERVWVNGQVVYQDGVVTEARPGRVLRRAE